MDYLTRSTKGPLMATITLDPRLSSPIATRSGVARLLEMRPEKLSSWSKGLDGRAPLVHTVRGYGRFTVPLVGIAEAAALDALRAYGLSMQQIRKAAEFVREEFGNEYAVASPQLLTDGAEMFVEDTDGIYRLRDRQVAIREVIERHLRPIEVGPDGIPEAFVVERFTSSRVTIDPRFNAGQMSFVRSRVPLFTVADALAAGDRIDEVAGDFGLSVEEVADVNEHRDWLAHVS